MTTTFGPPNNEGDNGPPKEFVRMIPLTPIVESMTKALHLYKIGEIDDDQMIGHIFKLLTVPINKK